MYLIMIIMIRMNVFPNQKYNMIEDPREVASGKFQIS